MYYIFEVKYERRNKRAIVKSFEYDRGIYTLRDSWHQVIEDAIKSTADDEIIADIKLIARLKHNERY